MSHNTIYTITLTGLVMSEYIVSTEIRWLGNAHLQKHIKIFFVQLSSAGLTLQSKLALYVICTNLLYLSSF